MLVVWASSGRTHGWHLYLQGALRASCGSSSSSLSRRAACPCTLGALHDQRRSHHSHHPPIFFQQAHVRTRTRRRFPSVRVEASKRNPYDVLGVPRGATMKDIKRAYRKKALKLHPDVNKAPDAKEQFMECKQAYQELVDGRGGVGGRGRGGTGPSSSSSYGSSSSSYASSNGSYYREKRRQEEEDFYGLGDLFRDIENEWQRASGARPAGGEPKSLWEELADIGEDLLDYLERNMPEERERGGMPMGRDAGGGYASSASSPPRPTPPPTPPRPTPPPTPPPPPRKKSVSVDDELAEMKRRMGL